MRLFAALPVPESGRGGLGRSLEPLRESLPDAKWVAEELWHLTLAFFGEVDPQDAERLARRLATCARDEPVFTARLNGLGAFPPRGRARVLWLGFEPREPAERLAVAVREVAREEAIRFDDRPLRCHVTVARARRPWPERARERFASAQASGERFPVERVALIKSRLGPSGPRYETVAEAPLSGGTP